MFANTLGNHPLFTPRHLFTPASCLIALIAICCSLSLGCRRIEVKSPEAYKLWNSKCGSFALDYPEGWIAQGAGSKSSGNAYAEFKKGSYVARVDASFGDSVKGDIMGMGGGMGGVPGMGMDAEMEEALSPEAQVHEFWLKHYQKKYKKYKEGEPESIRVPLGATRLAEFSAKIGFSNVRGIRATTMSQHRGVTFFAYCPAAQWEEFKPVYMHMLESMKRGVEKF